MRAGGSLSWEAFVRSEHDWYRRLVDVNPPAWELGVAWTGDRMLGDVTWAGQALEGVGVVHGDPRQSDAPSAHVHTSALPAGAFARSILARMGEPPPGPRRRPRARSTWTDDPGWSIMVDGHRIPVQRDIDHPHGWLGVLEVGPLAIVIEGHGVSRTDVATYELRRVQAFEPLFDRRLAMVGEGFGD